VTEKGPPDAVTPARLATLLSQAGGQKVAAAELRADVAAGAPVLSDGRIPILPYVAWLYRRAVHGD
jgi:hypothetical protein